MTDTLLAIKVDVDTDRGTRIGVPKLLALLHELNISATFLFSLGPCWNSANSSCSPGQA